MKLVDEEMIEEAFFEDVQKRVDSLLIERGSLAKQARAIDDELKLIRERAKALRDRASGKERKKRGPRKATQPRQALGAGLAPSEPPKADGPA